MLWSPHKRLQSCKKYISRLSQCFLFSPVLAVFIFLALPAAAATLSVNASNGSATISQGGVYDTLNVTGSSSPTLNITKGRLTLIGTGKNANPIITGAASVFLNAVNTTLSLGSATNMKGGVIRGDIKLDNSTLRIYGPTSPSSLLYYTISAAGETTGKIEGDGNIILRPDAILNSGAIGSNEQAMSSISIAEAARLQFQKDLWANSVDISGGNLSAVNGDIHIESLNLNGVAPSLQANNGDVYLGTVNASSPDNELLAHAGISSLTGNVTISGKLLLEKGLTSITAGKDVLFETGEAVVRGAGELYIKAGGNLSLDSAQMSNSHLQALKLSITGDLEAKNVLGAQISAGSVNIGENLEVQGNSVQIFGTQVSYGDLTINGKGGKVGGDLKVFDARVDISDLTVGRNAIFSAVKGSFNSLDIEEGLDFAAGDLSGNSLKVKSIQIGESVYASTLSLKKLSFASLQIGKLGTVRTELLESPHGSLILSNGGSFELASGDIGSEDAPLGNIILGGASTLNAPASLYASSLAGITGTNKLSAYGDIKIFGDITGNLALSSEGDISAESISVSSIKAKNAEITGGKLAIFGKGEIENDLSITGRQVQERTDMASVSAYFNDLHVGGTMTVRASSLYGKNLVASTLLAGNELRPTYLYIANMADGFGLGVGKNAFVTLGESSSNWLSATLAANGRSSVNSALGVAQAVKLGPTGLSLNPEEVLPAPAKDELVFSPDSMLVVYAPNAREDINHAGIISAESNMTAHIQDGAKLMLDGVVANQIYGILGDNITTFYENNNAWNDSAIETGSHLTGLKKMPGRNGWFYTYAKEPETVYPGLDPGLKPPLAEGSGGSDSGSGNTTPAQPSTPSENPGTSSPTSPANPSSPSTPGDNSDFTPSTPGENPGITPSNPGESEKPNTNPSAPTRPDTPSTPSENPGTSSPSSPANPSTPSTPGDNSGFTPSTPGENPGITPPNPGESEKPNTNPSAPTRPDTPSTPSENPGTSSPTSPANPSTPSTPGDNSDFTPSNPGESEKPNTNPSAPTQPDTPSIPSDNPDETQKPSEKPEGPGDEPATRPGQELKPAEPALGTDNRHFYSNYAGVRFLSRVTSTKFMGYDYNLAWRTIESSARMAILGAVPQMAYSANMGAVDAAEGRAVFADKAPQRSETISGYGWSLWLVPMYRNLQGYKLQAYNLDYNFSGALGGIVLGSDYSLGDKLRFGIDASIGGGYACSSGDMAKTSNDMGFSGIGAYTGWLPGNFGFSADIHYTWTWNSLKQEFPTSLDMKDPEAELTARVLSAGFRAEYRIPFDDWQIIPHAGVRFAYVHTDNYSIYSGGAMIDGQAIDQNIWTYPLGIEVRGDFTLDSGWIIQPSLDILLTPASGDIYATTKLNYTGVPGEANIDTQTMDYLRYGTGAGFIARKDNFNFGLDYKIQTGWRGTDQSVFGTFCYEF